MRASICMSTVIALVLSLCAAASADNWIEFEVCTYNTGVGQRYDAGIYLGVDGVSGAGKVQGQFSGSSWFPFNHCDLGGGNTEYYLETPENLTLAELNSGSSGLYKLKVTTATGDCVYDFSINTITAGMFAPIPEITDPNDGATVPQNVNFQWTWGGNTGDVDELWAEVEPLSDGASWAEGGSYDGSINIGDTSWQPGLTNTGQAWFVVGYDIEDPMDGTGLFSAISFDAGSSTRSDFGWDEQEAYLTSGDEIDMTVVPEPATLALLGLGACLLLRRRRR